MPSLSMRQRNTPLASNRKNIDVMAIIFVLAAALYNAALAFLNARGISQSFATVALVDVSITSIALLVLVIGPGISLTAFYLIVVGCVLSIQVSVASEVVSLECARNFIIIATFYTYGRQISPPVVLQLFRILSVVTVAVLLFELTATATYADLFQPSLYYFNTRGLEEFKLDDSGLFRGALGFEDRFTFGFSSHRTSSIFIEQVSLANYAAALVLLTLSLFERMTRFDRVLAISTIVLILVTNNARTSSVFALVCLAGFFLFPYIPRAGQFLVMPGAVGSGALLYAFGDLSSAEDNFEGRVAKTMKLLSELDAADLAGFGAKSLINYVDSGYVHVTASSTIIGALVLWLVLGAAVPRLTKAQSRCSLALNLMFGMNLMIGGTSVFALKVAALVWLIVGCTSALRPETDPYERAHVPAGGH